MQHSKLLLIHLLFMIIWTTTIKTPNWISFTKVSLLLLKQITHLQKDFKSKFKYYTENSFFVLHLNISSLSKGLESFKKLYNLPWNYNTNGNKCKKVPCYMRDSGGLLLKKPKYFEVMLNIFEFSWVWEYVEYWLVFGNKLSWIAQLYFSNNIKTQS